MTICAVCDQQVDPDDAHWPHQAGCTRHDCTCDLPTCPACCPDCNPTRGRP